MQVMTIMKTLTVTYSRLANKLWGFGDAGYAFETEVLKLATALHATLVEDGVDLTVGAWTYVQYEGKFLEDHNEV
jgi:hypothetical protein